MTNDARQGIQYYSVYANIRVHCQRLAAGHDIGVKRVWGRGSFMFVYAAFIFIAFSSSKVWYAKAGVSGNELTGACAP